MGMLHKVLHWHLQSLLGMFNGLRLVALHKSMGTTSQENPFSKSQVIDDNLKFKQSSQIEMLFHSRSLRKQIQTTKSSNLIGGDPTGLKKTIFRPANTNNTPTPQEPYSVEHWK